MCNSITWHSMHRQLSFMLHVRPSNAAASLYSSVLDFRRSFRRALLRRRPSCFLLPPGCREDELPEFPLLLDVTSALPAGDPNKFTKPSTSCNGRQHTETEPFTQNRRMQLLSHVTRILLTDVSWCSSVLSDKCCDSTSISPRPLPHPFSFVVHLSSFRSTLYGLSY